MGYEIPESIDGLTDEQLEENYGAAFDEYKALAAKPDTEITDADLAAIERLGAHLDAITTAQGVRAQAATEREHKLTAARERVSAAESTPEPEPEQGEEAEEDDEPSEDAEPAEDAEAQIEEKEPVMASASSVEKALSQPTQGPAVIIPRMNPTSLVAAGKSLPSMGVNEEFEDLTAVALEFAKNAKRGPAGDMTKFQVPQGESWGLSENHVRNAFAKFQRSGRTHEIGQRMSADEQLRVINDAGRAPSGGAKALVAAGGWCAPSETVYDFCSYETVSGILDIPTIGINRGGINFTKGPDYAQIAALAASGFKQTEAQAEAGTAKVCLAVDCPPFEDHRLDAIGFCLTNGILTDTAYPELTRRYLEILTVAHAHRVNKYVIDAILADVGAAAAFTGLGVTTADTLEALTFHAWRLRTMYAMGPNAVIEGFMPTWAKPVIQADLSRRTGVDMLNVSDAQINSFFAARDLRIQFVEDFIPMNPATATGWPTALEAVLYPAGAFIKGTDDVISLDTIYDSVGLSTNTYTAAFFEEGILVANRCASGLRVSIPVCNSGQTGAADITCVAA